MVLILIRSWYSSWNNCTIVESLLLKSFTNDIIIVGIVGSAICTVGDAILVELVP